MRTGRTGAGGAALCALLALASVAQAGHGVGIEKTCVGPEGDARARAGDTITCRITVTNHDTLNDTLRVDTIVDSIENLGGPTVTPNLLQQDLSVACVVLPPGASVTVMHQFTAGDPENDPLASEGAATGADLRNGGAPVPPGCPAGGLGFAVAFGAQVDIVECLADPDCDAGNPCSDDLCASGNCFHTPAMAGTVCRSSMGVCDPDELCSGSSFDCPADAKSTAICRSAVGTCDVAEPCDGVGDGCPPDTFAPATVVCRSAVDVCDMGERCTGSGVACPGDGLVPYGTVCRSAAGVCDAVEKCTGSSVACPADVKKTGVCRPSAGDCDVVEVCNGTSDCPPDAFAPSTISCRAASAPCDMREYCSGTGPTCPPDMKQPPGTVCRASVGSCDLQEVCDGANITCPANALSPAGALCPDDGAPCTLDVCNGTSVLCTHPAGNAGTTCRMVDPARECDQAETCTGTGITCPADVSKPPGTACTADTDVCTQDQCNAAGACVVTGSSNDPSCGVCGELATGPCVVTVDGVAGTFSTLQAGINAAPNGGVVHVQGVCRGYPLIKKRTAITIEGAAPATCPPGPNDLKATLMPDPAATPPSGSSGEVLKVLSSNNVVVRYLNIINGGDHDGLEFKTSANGTAFCNCVAKNDEGYELDAPGGHIASQSLIIKNGGAGVQMHAAQTASRIADNRIEQNAEDGIRVLEGSHHNEVSGNLCLNNALSGILLDNGDSNLVVGNDVHHNGVAGIRLKSGSDGNTIGSSAAPNLIHDNGDALSNLCLCVGDLTANGGTNVPAVPACQ